MSLVAKFRKFGKATIWLVLLSFLFCLLPIPFPLSSAPKNHSEPFPCEDCPCGCTGPEECWTSCCCKTPQERLAWAKSKGITPPSYAVLGDATPTTELVKKELKSCCASKSVTIRPTMAPHRKGSCCSSESCSKPKELCSSCSKASHSCCKSKPTAKSASKDGKIQSVATQRKGKLVLAIAIMKCKGHTASICMLPVFDLPRTIHIEAVPTLFSSSEIDLRTIFVSFVSDVPTPPPRNFSLPA